MIGEPATPVTALSIRYDRTPLDLPLSSRAETTPPSGLATRASIRAAPATATAPRIHTLPISTYRTAT